MLNLRIGGNFFSGIIPRAAALQQRAFEEFYSGWELENYNNSWRDVWRVTAEN